MSQTGVPGPMVENRTRIVPMITVLEISTRR